MPLRFRPQVQEVLPYKQVLLQIATITGATDGCHGTGGLLRAGTWSREEKLARTNPRPCAYSTFPPLPWRERKQNLALS